MAGNGKRIIDEASTKPLGETLFLIEPETNKNSGDIAKQLMQCKGVSEVRLTSGKFGFVVFCKEEGSKKTFAKVSRICRNRISTLEGHSTYRIK